MGRAFAFVPIAVAALRVPLVAPADLAFVGGFLRQHRAIVVVPSRPARRVSGLVGHGQFTHSSVPSENTCRFHTGSACFTASWNAPRAS